MFFSIGKWLWKKRWNLLSGLQHLAHPCSHAPMILVLNHKLYLVSHNPKSQTSVACFCNHHMPPNIAGVIMSNAACPSMPHVFLSTVSLLWIWVRGATRTSGWLQVCNEQLEVSRLSRQSVGPAKAGSWLACVSLCFQGH